LPALERNLLERLDAIDARMGEVIDLAGDVRDGMESGISAVRELDHRGASVLTLAERLDARAGEVLAAIDELDKLAPTAATLAASVEPLQGASERLGRIVDRLPGGRRPIPHDDDSDSTA